MILFIGMFFKPKKGGLFFNHSKIIFMALNLLKTIEKNLGFAELKKVDPNTQEIKANTVVSEDKLNQAALPAVLVSLYKYSRNDEGAEQILCGDTSQNWLQKILEDTSDSAVTRVANYAHVSNEKAIERMNLIAQESVKIIREKNPVAVKDVKNMIAAEKPTILMYLPPALQMGDLLNDETIDDRTHKMEGPVSGFMNAFGEIFNQSEKSKQDKS